ncbi:MAG: BrnT family toxin [Candidatus Binataceae bacterium]
MGFEDAAVVSRVRLSSSKDTRRNYGERRVICYGMLAGRLVVIGYTQRGTARHVFSMRKANDREKASLAFCFEI